MRPNKTFIPKVADLKKSWYVIDAEGLVLGRLAAIVANKLRGKDKVFFTPNMQCGDNIIIVNSEKVLLKGQKRLRLTDGSEYIRLDGIVRPQDISASNTVSSNLIAEAQIEYVGSGTLSNESTPGWGSKFVRAISPF